MHMSRGGSNSWLVRAQSLTGENKLEELDRKLLRFSY